MPGKTAPRARLYYQEKDMKPCDLGRAVVTPSGTFRAGETGTWTIEYTVGKYGIDDGGSIIMTRRAMSDAMIQQCDQPGMPGYTTAETDGDARITISFVKRYWVRPWRDAILVRVFDGSLVSGDTVRITLGDQSSGSPGWTLQSFPETHFLFRILVDSFGSREYYPLEMQPHICIVPDEPVSIEAIVPSSIQTGMEAPVKLRALDRFGNPADDFMGDVTLRWHDGTNTHENNAGASGAVSEIGTVCYNIPGIYTVDVTCGKMFARSNPIIAGDDSVSPLYWADMHGQTEATVGTGSVEEYFRFARDKGLMDATAWQGNDFQVRDSDWAEVCRETKAFHQPGSFVTFLGYEWSGLTPSGGDHNILYMNDDEPIHRSSHWQVHDGSPDESDRYPLSALWETFRGRSDVMAIAHVGGRYANLDFWDDELSGLVEIHSHHGTFEWIALDALRRGLVTGFVAQSDDHTGRPGLSAPLKPLARDFATFDVNGGYTGIYARELTRTALWEALRARHCYATTGKRIVLDVRSGDRMMGDVIEDGHPVELNAVIAGTAPLLDVEVLRDTETVYRHSFPVNDNDRWIRLEWSGVRVKSRSKTADWDGIIRINGGSIEDFEPYAFDRPDQGISRINNQELAVTSSTSGDIDGVFLKLSSQAKELVFENDIKTVRSSIDDINEEPIVFSAGGVNLSVGLSLCSPQTRPDKLNVTYRDPAPLPGRHAYWIKIVQRDGHMAWSSPIYFVDGASCSDS